MRLLIVIALLVFQVFSTTNNACCNELFEKTLDLGSMHKLHIFEDEQDVVTVSLKNGGRLLNSISVGNAGVWEDNIQRVKFCHSCVDGYFISVWDKSSTYGAETYIVVWKSGVWWNMNKLPFDRAGIKDQNSDNIHEIIDYRTNIIYSFKDGFLIPR